MHVTLKNTGQVFEATQETTSHHGKPGTLLAILLANHVDLDHACGGVGACATCHVRVLEGGDSAPAPADDELDMVELAPGARDDSRLACCCVPDGSTDLVLEIPGWNRNHAREGGP